MLDYAKNVDEAIELLKKYNIVFSDPAPPQHYLVADISGKSAVIEFVDGEIKVTYNTKPYQVSTNFMIYGSNKNDWDACSRYKRATEALENAKGCVSQKEALDIMKEVSVTSTQWSVVYNMKSGDIDIVMGGELKKIMDGDYGKTRSLKLKMRN
jgi:choloylglycine hydrolase